MEYSIINRLLITCIFTVLNSQNGLNHLVYSYNAESIASANSIWISALQTPQELLPSEIGHNKNIITYSGISWIKDVQSHNLFLSASTESFGFGLYYKYYGISNIEERTSPSIDPISHFTNYTSAIGFSGSYKLSNYFRLGVTYKVITESIYTSQANGDALDFSLSSKFKNLNVYVSSINNIRFIEAIGNTTSTIPQLHAVGMVSTWDDLNVGAEYQYRSNTEGTVHVFSSYRAIESFILFSGLILNSDTESVSFGSRFQYENYFISFGYAVHKYLSNKSSFQIGINL